MKKLSLILTVLFFSLIFVSCSGGSGGGSDPAPQEEEDPGGTTGGTSGGTATGGTSGESTGSTSGGGTETGGTGTDGGSSGGTTGGTTTGGTSGGTTGGGSSKDLFSLWLAEENNVYRLDFDYMDFGIRSPKKFSVEDGSTCWCDIFISGTQSEGTFDIFSCFVTTNGPENGCLIWENNGQPYEYFKNSNTLRVCTAPDLCKTFR